MNKTWLIFRNEYLKHVRTKRFIFAVLSMPLFIGVIVLVGFLAVWLQYNSSPVGYVDAKNVLPSHEAEPVKGHPTFPSVDFIRYQDETSARSALESGEVQAYFVITDNYLSNGAVDLVKGKKTGSNINDDISDFLRYNLLLGKPQATIDRLTSSTALIIRSADGSRELAADNWLAILLPFLAGILFIIAVNISGGYLLQAVVEEKENRTMEILITSVSPNQLMTGKVIGNLLVGLTELFLWMLMAILAMQFIPQLLPVGQSLKIEPSLILIMVGTFLPAFIMIASAMGAIGATASELREAQQIAGLFTLPIVVPFWFVTPLMFNPNGALAVGMSMFPLTAPIALPLRAVFTTVPFWQISVTIGLLWALAIFSIWLAGRFFHLGLLRYGKKTSFKEIFQKRSEQAGKA